MKYLQYCFIGSLSVLIIACQSQNENAATYINETGVYYSCNNLNELNITDSLEKKLTIEFVENDGQNEIIHFKHVNTFHFYKIIVDYTAQISSWTIGQIDYEYDILETLITEDSLTIESTYDPIYDKRENINGVSILFADHAGTIQISIKSPDKKLFSEKGDSKNWIWASGGSFESSNSIQWTASDNDVHGEQVNISTRNTLELKKLVNAENQVLVEYLKDF